MSALQQEIFRLAENELYEAREEQLEIQKEQRRLQRRAQAIIASGLLLSTLMGVAVGDLYSGVHARPLTMIEADAIINLMDYVAYKMGTSRDWVEEVIMAQFGVKSLADLKGRQYDDVVEYLLALVH
ncbi:MAG: hypothetical protein AB7G06_08385 [Bdellovibrionales bacterium]